MIGDTNGISVSNGIVQILDKATINTKYLDIGNNDLTDTVSEVLIDNATVNLDHIEITNNGKFDAKNNSAINSKTMRVYDGSVVINSGSKADFEDRVRTEGGILDISGDNTILSTKYFLRAGQATYTDAEGIVHDKVKGAINIKDGAGVIADQIRIRDVINVDNATLNSNSMSIGIADGTKDDEEGRVYKQKDGILNISNKAKVSAGDLRIIDGKINFNDGVLVVEDIYEEKSNINFAKSGVISSKNNISLDSKNLSGDGILIKQGVGQLALSNWDGTFKGNLQADDGVLKLEGDYTLDKDKTLIIGVSNLIIHGKIEANNVNLKDGSNLAINPTIDSTIDRQMLPTDEKYVFKGSIIDGINSLTANTEKINVSDVSSNYKYEIEKIGNSINLKIKGLERAGADDLKDKIISEDTKVVGDDKVIDISDSVGSLGKTDNGTQIATKSKAKLVISDGRTLKAGDKAIVFEGVSGNLVVDKEGKIVAADLVFNDGATLNLKDGVISTKNLTLDDNSKANLSSKIKVNETANIKGALNLTNANLEAKTLNLANTTSNNSKIVASNLNITENLNANKNTNIQVEQTITAENGMNLANSNLSANTVNLRGDEEYIFDNSSVDVDDFKFEGEKFVVKNNSKFNIKAKNTFKLDTGDATISNSNLKVVNAELGFLKPTKATLDEKAILEANQEIKFGKEGVNLIVNDATLKFENITDESGGKSVIEIKNATFENVKDGTIQTVVKGENFIKQGDGILKLSSSNKGWMNTEIKAGILNFDGDLKLNDKENLSIADNSAVVVNRKTTLGKDGILTIATKNDKGTLKTGKLKADIIDLNNANLKLAGTAIQKLKKNGDVIERKSFLEATKEILGKFNSDIKEDLIFYKLVFDDKGDIVIKTETVGENLMKKANYSALLDMGSKLDKAIMSGKLVDSLMVDNITAKDLSSLQPLLSGAGAKIVFDNAKLSREAIVSRNANVAKMQEYDKNFWGKAISGFSKKDANSDGTLGYDSNIYGGIVGLDGMVSDNASLGMAFSFTNSDVDGDLDHKLKSDIYQATLYSDIYANNNLRFNLIAGIGYAKNDGERRINFLNKTLKSSYDSNFYQLGFGTYYDININQKFTLIPYLRADYTNVQNDGYTEKEDNDIALKVDEQKFDSLVFQAGLKSKYNINNVLNIFAKAGLLTELLDDETVINASFVGANTNKFEVKNKNKNETLGLVGLGLDFKAANNLDVELNYDGEFGKKYNNQAVNLGFNYKF